jgi:hypothetical protein
VCAALTPLAGCAHHAAGTPAPGVVGVTSTDPSTDPSPRPDASSTDLPYGEYAPPTGLLGFPDMGPPDPGDPTGEHALQVLERHRAELSAIPGWQGDGVGRREGHNVIVVMTRRPVPAAERIATLEDVPVVYQVAGPFTPM